MVDILKLKKRIEGQIPLYRELKDKLRKSEERIQFLIKKRDNNEKELIPLEEKEKELKKIMKPLMDKRDRINDEGCRVRRRINRLHNKIDDMGVVV